MHKIFKKFGQEGRDTLTKEMDQIYRQIFWNIFIKDLIPQENIRARGCIMILEKKSKTKKLKRRMVFKRKTN